MEIVLPLNQMTLAEKLRTMEMLWDDLSRDENNLPSPSWHGTVLAQRDQMLREGSDAMIDWDAAKKDLIKRSK